MLRRTDRTLLGMVRADGVDRPVGDGAPESIDVIRRSERRADEEPLRIGGGVGALVEQQMVKADLCQYFGPPVLPGEAHLADGARRREVDEIRRRAGEA